jgi:peptidoglycan hydrolase-like protein with peptidoglycan-binding domain
MMQERPKLYHLLLGRLQLGLAGFAALSLAVLSNIFYLQPVPGHRTTRLELEAKPAPVRPRDHGDAARLAASNEVAITTRALQRELESRGYLAGTNDGVAGIVTRAAIMAYEYDHGLTLTGEPTEPLLRAVVLGTADPSLPAMARERIGPHAEQVIRTLQQALAGLGFGPISVDGAMGDETVVAIRRFERQHGMPESGRISGALVARLAKLSGLGQSGH